VGKNSSKSHPYTPTITIMSPSASSSYQRIETKAEELGVKHFQNMMNVKEPTDHPSITALAKLAKSLKIDVSTLKYTDFVQQHAEQLPAMLEECHNMENFKPFIKLLGTCASLCLIIDYSHPLHLYFK